MTGGTSTQSRDPALDGLRGVALLTVVVHNTGWIIGNSDRFISKLYSAAAAAGWSGVQLFFVLSGFLITGILVESRQRGDYYRRFYMRRTVRIFPLYYLAVGLAILIALTLAQGTTWAATAIANQWAFWLYLSNVTEPFGIGITGLSHAWSLAVEEQFYLVWPFVARTLRPRPLFALSLGLVIAGPFIRAGLAFAELPLHSLYTFPIARVDALACGSVVAICIRDDELRSSLERWARPLLVASTSGLGAIAIVTHGLQAETLPVLIAGQSLIAICSACLISFIVLDETSVSKVLRALLENERLRTIGLRSYAMYLAHAPIHNLLRPYFARHVQAVDGSWRVFRTLMYTMLVLVISYAVAVICWRLIERPLLALREKLKCSESDRSAAVHA